MAPHARCASPAWINHNDTSIHGLLIRADVCIEVLLESHSEGHKRELRRSVDLAWYKFDLFYLGLGLLCSWLGIKVWHFSGHVCAAGTEDDPNISVRRLGAESRAENAEQVEVGHVIQSPCRLQTVFGDVCLAAHWCHCIRAEDDRVETAGWSIVNPFRCKESYAMKRCEIDVFSSYEFVPGLFAQVFDIVDEKGVDEGLLDQ